MSVPASLSEPVFPPLRINPELVRGILVGFIRNEVRKVGFERVVLGLSGGVDSSLVAPLATEALGPKNVVAFIMPYKTSDPKSKSDALQVVQQLGIHHLEIDISPQIDAYFARFPDADQKRRGNKMARERMSILYDQSWAWRALVIGTSNKTELLLGYGTIYGDMASAINPIGDLYKTQVWQLADALGVPTSIVQKAPSADLWAGQSDETELGFQYRMIDQLLYYLVERRYSVEELKRQGFDEAFITDIVRRVRENQYKRRLPVIAKLSSRTIDRDFRYPRDWGRANGTRLTLGTLYLVATPIGNLDDITLRALHVLESAPLIAAEDTRHTLKLLTHFGLRRQMISLHAKNEALPLQTILARLEQHDIALVSDAGTPALSDPGVRLVSAAVAAGYPVVPIPGPSAGLAAPAR